MLFKRGRAYLYLVSLLCGAAIIYGAIAVFGVEVSVLLASLLQIVLLVLLLMGLAAVVVYVLSLVRKLMARKEGGGSSDE